jgi:hypothetical protein
MIVQTPDANLSQGMQWLGLSYSSWFNARRDRVGPLFQGRFRSVLVEGGVWALELSYYVHLNPLRTAGFGLERGQRRAAAAGVGPPPPYGSAAAGTPIWSGGPGDPEKRLSSPFTPHRAAHILSKSRRTVRGQPEPGSPDRGEEAVYVPARTSGNEPVG